MEQPTGDDVVIGDTVEFKRTSNLFPLPKCVDVSKMTIESIFEAEQNEGDEE